MRSQYPPWIRKHSLSLKLRTDDGFVTLEHIDIAVTNEVDTAQSPCKDSSKTLLAFDATHMSFVQEKCEVTALL